MVAPIRCLEASWVIGLHVEYRSRHHVPPSILDSGLGDWLGLTMERDRLGCSSVFGQHRGRVP